MLLEGVLRVDGYELIRAHDGARALELARERDPDLVLLDVILPGMDGFAVCRGIRAEPALAHMPVVILTALSDREARLAGIFSGADDFISKPFDLAELRARVRTITRLNRFRHLAAERTRFERLFEFAPSAIVLVDEEARVTALNPRARALMPGLAIGRPVADGLSAADLPVVAGALGRAGSDQPGEGASGTILARVAEGERRLRVRASSLAERPRRETILIFDDVTDEHRAHELLAERNTGLAEAVAARTAQLEEMNRLLVSYAAFVSHDLRSPLAVVKGYLSLLVQDRELPAERARELLVRAHEAALDLDGMVNNLLKLAAQENSPDSAPPMPVDPRPLIQRICINLRGQRPDDRTRFSVGDLPAVAASPELIERVFFNLLSNAAKYCGHRPAPHVEVGAIDTPEGPVIFVRDNGVGFDAREEGRLFREFSRLRENDAQEGFGLGLALVSRLLRAHQGRIWAEGRPGVGATFFVRFGHSRLCDRPLSGSACGTAA